MFMGLSLMSEGFLMLEMNLAILFQMCSVGVVRMLNNYLRQKTKDYTEFQNFCSS